MEAILPQLLLAAWLLPLLSFVLILLAGTRMGKGGRGAGYLATAAIGVSCLLSIIALVGWLVHHPLGGHGGHSEILTGDWYTLAQFELLRFSVGYYVDSLTLGMFVMVTFIAFWIHIYSFGYMHEELHDVRDPLVTAADGGNLIRPGRFHRFYQYLSLFCFSMLGLVVANNLFMVFAFWELVGICSYFLIGFYVERPSATLAGNKAFIVNRVGDFGMIVGLATFLFACGTLHYATPQTASQHHQGLFAIVKEATSEYQGKSNGAPSHEGSSTIPGHGKVGDNSGSAITNKSQRNDKLTPVLLTLAGLALFCGCIGKSAQFPLHVWLPDAMEGPTPVSALIHAATMVAAGVYLVARIYPLLTAEALLVVALVGTVTLFLAATMAVAATDIKRVLAYSTISQLGYMMLGLGVGGWVAGLFHLFTHAFFKALLFLGAGSVIHACGTNEMPSMGGLGRKMPWTAATMLVGCLAISGAGIPLLIGLSGYYSKDAILAQTFLFHRTNPLFGWMFYVALGVAGITAFYMFRLWFLVFWGEPRDEQVAHHVHESPRTMVAALVVLAVLSVISGWSVPGTSWGITSLLEQSRVTPATEMGTLQTVTALRIPEEHASHEPTIHAWVSGLAFLAALLGFAIATLFYAIRWLDPEDVRQQFKGVCELLVHRWYFDQIYEAVFVRNVLRLAAIAAWIDRNIIDWLADHAALAVRGLSQWDDWIDRTFVDGAVNTLAAGIYDIGIRLRRWQVGRIRVYIMWIVIGIVALFIIGTIYLGIGANISRG